MKFSYFLLFGVLCTTITILQAEDVKKELKINNNNSKKATTSEKKSFDKKSTVEKLLDASSPVSSSPSPNDELLEVGAPEYENYEDPNDTTVTEPTAITKANETTETDVTDQRYYFSEIIHDPVRAKALWVDLNTLPKHQIFKHEVLSESHRRAASINLPFKFPFYGQNLTKATIATGGFLYMGEHIHSWLAATQYIAPLMAHFDTRNSNKSNILYGYNSSLFVIQWERVNLLEKNNTEFTFQCILYRNGDIAFVYKDIPIPIQDISDDGHPVKIGVSDAYFVQRAHIYLRRKTIYEYHKVDMINNTIGSNNAIFLTAKPTCISLRTCNECVSKQIGFDCTWCAAAQRCSDGYDRHRQDWIMKGCEADAINNTAKCSEPIIVPSVEPVPIEIGKNSSNTNTANNGKASPTPNSTSDHAEKHYDVHDDTKNATDLSYNTQESKMSPESGAKRTGIPKGATSGHFAATFMFLLAFIGGIAFWGMYAYRNPTTPSGQLLIRWRPSHWRWVYPETRYTAASIHM